MRMSLFWLGAAVLVGLAAIGGLTVVRGYRMQQLAATAGASLSDGKQAVAELASYEGERARHLLLQIALNPEVFVDNRIAAVEALKRRPDGRLSGPLSTLLQPHLPLALRHAVSTALLEIPCARHCVQSVLHYLEREWKGEGNIEDAMKDVPTTRARLDREQEEILDELRAVLKKHLAGTLEVLADTYGLGSALPSDFSLYIVERLAVPQACTILNQSMHRTLDKTRKDAVRVVAQRLKCPDTPGAAAPTATTGPSRTTSM